MERIKDCDVDKVIVTNTLPLPDDACSKIVQISVAPMIAHVIMAEHFKYSMDEKNFEMEQED
jgi:phosphoribosylpyrophosphate synthetase